jgi:hypothetical protein
MTDTSAQALRELAGILTRVATGAVDINGANNSVAGRDICTVSARGRGVAVAGHYFEIHLHVSAPPRRKRGSA